jgi:glycosyltransferase involved in cell wall biosynthesis
MKILISVSYYAPHISGLTNSIKNLAEGLAQKGHNVNVLTTQHKKNLKPYEVIEKVHVERVAYLFKLQKGFIAPLLLIAMARKVQGADCVLINLPQLEGVFVALLGKLFQKKVVSVYACEVSLPKSFISPVIEQILFLSHFLTLLLSDKVVTLSDDYAKHSKLLRKFKKKTVGIYPIISKPEIPPAPFLKGEHQEKSSSPLRKGLVAAGGFKIGFLGRLSAEKGLEYLLEAIPQLKKQLGDNFVILLAGPKAVGEQKYVKKIEALAQKYKDNVSFVSVLSDDELGAFYQSLDVLVLPSINSTEAFGMVQVEAMYCGTPVVVSDLPGVRVPVMVTGMGEIVKKKDSKDLARKIIKVINSRKAYVEKKSNLEEIFSPEKVVVKYEQLLI